jgi:hypothetical protein
VFQVRGSEARIHSNFTCKTSKSKLNCQLDDYEDVGDLKHSGKFVLTETKDGVIVSPTTNLVLSESIADQLYTLGITTNSEHQTFTLQKVNVPSCDVK